MNNPAQFDRATLSAVKPGVDATLCELNAQLERFLANPTVEVAALTRVQSELNRLLGVFKMIRLEGVAVFCAELNTVLTELAATPQMTSALHREELRAALSELTRYLDDLAQGADNTTLRLFASYQQMQQLRGLEMSFELDLFFPNLGVQLPSGILNMARFPDPVAYFKAARNYYQQGLLRYLRQEDPLSALKLMQQAVNVAMTSMPPDHSRAFWWVCSGLIDCVSHDGLPADLSAQKIFGRIDQQMRAVIAGNAGNHETLLNEILYLIGRSHNVSETVALIKHTYALDRYFPESTTLSPAELAKRLGVVRELLRNTEEQWELCVGGDHAACANFVTQAKLIAQQNEKLDLNTLQYLAQQIAKYAVTTAHAENIPKLGMDIAIALLLLGSGIAHYRELDGNFQEQVRLLSERIQAEIDDQPLEEQHLETLVALYCQTERNDALYLLSKEMLINVQQIENGLNGLFADISKRDELGNVQRWLKQIQGGLSMSALHHAAQLLDAIRSTIQLFVENDKPIKPTDSRAVAGALSQLEGYLQQLPNGHQDQVEGLLGAIRDLQQVQQPAPPPPPVLAEAAAPVVQVRSGEDQELLEIFLEEAVEVLGIMRANLEICQLTPTDHDALVTMRRGFHTLKGSGRMVGLVEIGEVAWAAENAMNKWLQHNKPATPQLLNFIEQAVLHFSGWVESLGSRGVAVVQADELLKLAQRVEEVALGNVRAVVEDAPPVAPSAPQVASAPAREVDTLHIGDRTLSLTLFKIGSDEAKQHAAALRHCLSDLKETPSLLIQHDFMRAAHTLAGVNRAMGFASVVDLASALESWLQMRIETPSMLHHSELPMLEQVIATLEEMAGSVCNQQMPSARDDLVQALRANKDLLAASVEVTPAAEVSVPEVAIARVEDLPSTSASIDAPAWELAPTALVAVPLEFAPALEIAPAAPAVPDAFADFFTVTETPVVESVAPALEVAPVAPAVPDGFADFFAVTETPVVESVAPALEIAPAAPAIPDGFADFFTATESPVVESVAPALEVAPVAPAIPDGFADFFTATESPVVESVAPALEVAPVAPAIPDGFADFFTATESPVVESVAPALEVAPAVPAIPDGFADFFTATESPVVESVAPALEVAPAVPAIPDGFADFFTATESPVVESVAPALEIEPVAPAVPEGFADFFTAADVSVVEPVIDELEFNALLANEVTRSEVAAPVVSEFAPVEVVASVTPTEIDLAKLFAPVSVQPVIQPIMESRQETAPSPKTQVAEPPATVSTVRDDVDEQLLPMFLEEADDLVPKMGACLRAWRDTPKDDQQSNLLKRLLHTIKGSGRMAGAMRIGEIAHDMESRVIAVAKLGHQVGYWDGLEHEFDRISALVEELRSGTISPLEAQAVVSEEEVDEIELDAEITNVIEDTPVLIEEQVRRRTTERAALGGMLRVRADVIDRLVNEAGEISVTRSRMESELRVFKDALMELTGSVNRLRQQLREVEIQAESQMQARITLSHADNEQFDPLEFDRFTRLQELTRFMNESVHDVQTVQQTLLKNLDETTAAMSAQARLNRDLQQRLMNVRMVPFDSIADRLYRIVRQTGKDLKKRANLELQGGNVELDRSVLEKMTAPFEHLLRNAIAHGLEYEPQRVRANKPSIGEIRLSLRQENNEVVFELNDDGNGLNFDALRAKAVTLGFSKAGDVLSEQQLSQLIFVSGVSTANEVSAVAGRGIGMDVVRSEIAGLGGRIDVSSTSGAGTRFTIHLPLTLAVMQTVMVRSGEAIFAVPATMIEQVLQVKSAEMSTLHLMRQVQAQGRIYPLHYLPTLLGDDNHVAENQPRNALLLLRSAEQRIALHVDELLGRHEAVVKNIGPQLARLIGVAGATVRGDGAVVLILNPVQMAQRVATVVHKAVAAAPEVLRTQPIIMVVDDSLTVRKITSRLLTRAGYQVVTATDGVNALEQLGDITPDVMLLDVEMPRMDGFELTKNIRRNSSLKQFPIIMITSRTANKHRDYAMELGVNAYLGKPYQEDDLLRRIAEFVDAAVAA